MKQSTENYIIALLWGILAQLSTNTLAEMFAWLVAFMYIAISTYDNIKKRKQQDQNK